MTTTTLRFIERPLYRDAHPDDAHDAPADLRCENCAVAECPTTGRRFLLWLSNGVHWSLSRVDPHFGTDVRLGEIDLVGLP